MSPSKNIFALTSLQIFLTTLAALAACGASAMERQVTVTGSCSRQVTTDRGSITVTADVRDDNLKNAIKKASRQYDRALDSVKKLKLENADLQTVEYNVGEVREWEKNKLVFKGYRARIGFSVSTSDIQRLSEVMEIAAREEIRDVGALVSFLSTEKIKKEQDLCLKDAADHAKAKAENLASSLSARLGSVTAINESNVSTPPRIVPMMERQTFMKAAGGAEAPTSVEGGKQEISATVNVTFELK
ncbi:MAG: SIMPL domain-containing protein [Bdellovibrionia bacterium]